MLEAAAKLGVSNHQIRRLIKEGVLPAKQVSWTGLGRSEVWIYRKLASKLHWNGKVARVGQFPKVKTQSFQQ